MANTYAGISVAAVNLDDPQHKVMTFNAGSGGAWGRRGVTLDSTGTAWTTTGDGVYDPTSDPPRYANSVVGVHLVNGEMKLKDYYTPRNWDWLRKRDLDPNNTPVTFTYKGRELIAASGKECRVFLLDPKSAGGADHQTPLHKTDAVLQRGGGLPGHGQLGRALDVGRVERHALGAGAVLGAGALAVQGADHEHPGRPRKAAWRRSRSKGTRPRRPWRRRGSRATCGAASR